MIDHMSGRARPLEPLGHGRPFLHSGPGVALTDRSAERGTRSAAASGAWLLGAHTSAAAKGRRKHTSIIQAWYVSEERGMRSCYPRAQARTRTCTQRHVRLWGTHVGSSAPSQPSLCAMCFEGRRRGRSPREADATLFPTDPAVVELSACGVCLPVHGPPLCPYIQPSWELLLLSQALSGRPLCGCETQPAQSDVHAGARALSRHSAAVGSFLERKAEWSLARPDRTREIHQRP